jgi:hypothetical protein
MTHEQAAVLAFNQHHYAACHSQADVRLAGHVLVLRCPRCQQTQRVPVENGPKAIASMRRDAAFRGLVR